MNNKENMDGYENDLYEEILTNESLDPYEGLLKYLKDKDQYMKGPFKEK
tara:strand:+ start:302 stop:448 length:147 start_codon:yes stop_codon:yes gene_type:complete